MPKGSIEFLQTHGAKDRVEVIRRLTGAKSIKISPMKCEVNMTRKYTVASLTILSRIVGIPDRLKRLAPEPTRMMIKNARRSVGLSGGGFRERWDGRSETASRNGEERRR